MSADGDGSYALRSSYIYQYHSSQYSGVARGLNQQPCSNTFSSQTTFSLSEGHISSSTKKLGQSGGVAGKTKVLNLKKFTFSELRSATSNFSPDMCIGEGGFGKVYKGWLDDATLVPQKAGDGLAVAIKGRGPNNMQGLSEWQAEVDILGTFSHPNVVKLLGYCQKSEKEFLLVYEYMQKGSLNKHLYSESGEQLPWETRMKIAFGVAQGLAFLHATENNVIYRDVKTSNIVLDGDFNAKLTDFGLARSGPVNGESHVSTRVGGTIGYMAPDALWGYFTVKSDVYGFGIVLLEMITGLSVYDKKMLSQSEFLVVWATPCLANIKELPKIMDHRLGQVYPLKGAMKVAKLILNCLEMHPIHRPSMEEVVASLKEINSIKITPGDITAMALDESTTQT